MAKKRIDLILVEMGLAETRNLAQRLVMAGKVRIDGQVAMKASQNVPDGATVTLDSGPQFVSRGGHKLAAAMDAFSLPVQDAVCADVGASTGGFTDCLLQEGARKVFAVDVGYGQLAWKLRDDQRVINLERTNIRHLTPDQLDEIPDLAVIDASFISLEKVLPSTTALIKPGSDIIALIKPQFEVGKGQVGKGGVVRDPDQHAQVIEKIKLVAAQAGCQVMQLCESPILGTKGNREFLMHLRTGRS